jgi:hypothetical protein
VANRSLFFYIGIFLIVMAFVLLPLHIEVKVEGSLMGETERMGFGWLFALVLGAWAFASLVLSAMENYGQAQKRRSVLCLPS